MNDKKRNPMKPYKTNTGSFSAMWTIVEILAFAFVFIAVFWENPEIIIGMAIFIVVGLLWALLAP